MFQNPSCWVITRRTHTLRRLAPSPVSRSVGGLLRRGFFTSPARHVHSVEEVLSQEGSSSRPSIFDEFSLRGRVGVVSGANRGLGLEMALALCELGAKIYAIDLPSTPSHEFKTVASHVKAMGEGRKLEYINGDVTDQMTIRAEVEKIGMKEGRFDVCVAAAGILGPSTPALELDAREFEKVLHVNANGVFYTAQAAGREMIKFGNGGSIIMIASMSGTVTNRDHKWVAYNTSKSAVLQMARSMACELGPEQIRVNTLSPGHIYTKMTAVLLDSQPELHAKWASSNPLGRLGLPEELRGVIAWLASDASTFCTGSDIIVSGGHTIW
ncbi:uncharacterized protein EI90DRAFT_2905810 [Cantharellus anzutake]|uniref:uncharacterized protein n=1 Tax=Cantharellus anzutake TaxID=1750568 RepID=UPI0019065A3E|nr:uncharacterized protein EI90DRAFT_2905810 [Cantharellus anzutake]KAF8341362.1 hypothetical protein EI90DRAFT_2905810 [Cantharellus anzutake]